MLALLFVLGGCKAGAGTGTATAVGTGTGSANGTATRRTRTTGGWVVPATGDGSGTPTDPLQKAYGASVRRIINAVLAKNNAFARLRQLCDGIGHRISGSKALDRAIAWAQRSMRADKQENVHAEKVMVTHWIRGSESLWMVEPRRVQLPVLALGGSVGTPPGGISAEVIVAKSFKHLAKLGDRVKGRIVLFNAKMLPYSESRGTMYGKVVQYRYHGPSEAANRGALAALVRSPTARSLRSPHTGALGYKRLAKGNKPVPGAGVATEDADLIARLSEAGKRVKVKLVLGAHTAPKKVPSANVIGELRGREKPDEIVVIGGHIDSWDVGQGAHDDGAGVVMAMEALAALRRLGMRARRTIRVVLFTNEENGLGGAKAYARTHAAELSKHVAAIEADTGGFAPRGFSLRLEDKAAQARAFAKLRRLIGLLAPVGATRATLGWTGADITPMRRAGVMTLGLRMDISRYFDYHHTRADTLDKVDPGDLSRSTAAVAAMAWLLAELPQHLAAKGNAAPPAKAAKARR